MGLTDKGGRAGATSPKRLGPPINPPLTEVTDVIELPPEARKRKVLTLPRSKDRNLATPTFVPRDQSKFMVWREGGDMPRKLYDEPNLPHHHASLLAKQHPGERFHVMRTWRLCEAKSD